MPCHGDKNKYIVLGIGPVSAMADAFNNGDHVSILSAGETYDVSLCESCKFFKNTLCHFVCVWAFAGNFRH